jgi:hypothetical protein
VNNHGRAGDAITSEDTLVLTLAKSSVPQFVLYVPGFKALSISAAQRFIISKAKKEEPEDDGFAVRARREKPLKYAVVWVRFVCRLGAGPGGSWASAVSSKLQQSRQMKENTMEWVYGMEELLMRMRVDAVEEEDPAAAQPISPLDASRQRALELAGKTTFGSSTSLADWAAKRKWRTTWRPDQQIRAETLRIASQQPGGLRATKQKHDAWLLQTSEDMDHR